jgi:DNA replication and repair protein RecF
LTGGFFNKYDILEQECIGLYLKSLKLNNFRNYRELNVNFDTRLNFLIGNNAQGKTNVLEAIYCLSTARSFRTQVEREMIGWGGGTAYIKGIVAGLETDRAIEIGFSGNNKKIRVNGVDIKKRGDLLGNLSVVIFSPEELKLVKEGPSFRRRFMDQEIIQIKPSYYHSIGSYNRILMQRNALLRRMFHKVESTDSLDIWDRQLVHHGARIIKDRSLFIKRLAMIARLIHRRITCGGEDLEIGYNCCIQGGDNEGIEHLESIYQRTLQGYRERDLVTGITGFGPHREDLSVRINGMDIRKFGSQGQQRTAALSMKLSELELIKGEIGRYPVLLLDDVMSELDPFRQRYILENLEKIQVFITCTELTDIMKKRASEGKVFKVDRGIITEG